MDIIEETCKERGVDFGALEIKPAALEHYIESTCDNICKRIIEEKSRKGSRTNDYTEMPKVDIDVDQVLKHKLERLINQTRWIPYCPDRQEIWATICAQL
jgi:hypothetical protein